jgi:DNA-nicking Smr family endonuclease
MDPGDKKLDSAGRQLWQAAMRDAKPLKRGRRLAPAEQQADGDAPAKPPPSPKPTPKSPSADIPQVASWFAEIIPPCHRRGNEIIFAVA